MLEGLYRRRFATRWLLASLVVAAAVPVAAQQTPPRVQLRPHLEGTSRPTHVTHAGDGSGRLFVVEQAGRILVAARGSRELRPFLDIRSLVSCCGERGLFSVAFPPSFSSRRHFYVDYTDVAGNTVVARYRLAADGLSADPTSEEVVLRVDQPFPNHNGGQLAFGPDGYLYIGMGDGGSGGDPQNNAQNLGSLLGKLLRIDVESAERPYRVPASNPFANRADARGEIWALGLRNPWRFSFDRQTGDLYIADVGQGEWEEVNFQAASSRGGENYGWRIMEGDHCFNPRQCSADGLVRPIAEYSHADGCSVTGGFVPRAGRYPDLAGTFLYADFCTGHLWGARRAGNAWGSERLLDTGRRVSSFGEDEAGNVYLADYGTGEILLVADAARLAAYRYVIPAVAHLPGAGGTPWRTELLLVNPGSETARVSASYQGSAGARTAQIEVASGASREVADVLVTLFGLDEAAAASGVVRLDTEVPLVVTARLEGRMPFGSVGQTYRAVTDEDGLSAGQVGLLPHLRSSARAYTNIGVVNLGEEPCEARVQLRDAAGAEIGEPLRFALDPGAWRQVFDAFAAAGAGAQALGRGDVEVATPGCRIWAYGSVIERGSRDPVLIPLVTE